MNGTLRRLEELTNNLPPLESLASYMPQVVEYEVENGVCFGFGLYSTPQVSVQRAFMCKGTTFPQHQHDTIEYLIVYRGRLRVDISGVEICTLDVGMSQRFPSGTPHSVTAIEDTWMIGISIPSEEGYPHG